MTSTILTLKNVLFFCSFLALAYSKQLPSYIKPCKKNDPHLEQCLINLMNGLKPRLAKGIPEMKIPPLEPFFVPFVKMDQGSQAVNFKAAFKNMSAHNAAQFELKKVKIDFKEPSMVVEVFFPHLTFESLYTINGKVLVVPINGDGPAKGNLSKVAVTVDLKGKYLQKGGKTYLHIDVRKISFKIGTLWLHFDNLFGGKNKALGDTTNEFINQNWKEIIEELSPLLEEIIGQILLSVLKGFLELYAIEDLFPNS